MSAKITIIQIPPYIGTNGNKQANEARKSAIINFTIKLVISHEDLGTIIIQKK